MAKPLRIIATVAAVVAIAASVAITLGATAPIAGVALSTIATIASTVSAVAAAASQALQKPPDAQGTVNEVLIGANMPVPYVMGRTFVGGMKVYDNSADGFGGKPNNNRTQIFVGSHAGPIDSFQKFLADYSEIIFASYSGGLISGVASDFYGADGGYMWLGTRKGLRPDTAHATPSGRPPFTGWGTSHKLSGMASWAVSMEFDEDGVRYASGIPAFGMVAKWVLAYDPRLDSTYPGGSGPQRWNDESTWAWSENPAIHALTYARGRFMGANNVKVVGVGLPQTSIEIPLFIELANVCDANGWTVGGAVYEGPGLSRWDNLKRILQAAAAEPAWVGGLLTCRYSAPKVSLFTVTTDDLVDGDVEIQAMRSWKDKFNTIVPRYRSEAHSWDYVQADAVVNSTYLAEDGESKTDEVQFDLVQNKDQAAELAAYMLVNRREFGPIKINAKPWMMGFRPGEAGTIDIPEAGLSNQLAVITARSVDPGTGAVQLTLESETTAKHAYALGQTGVAPPTPTIHPPEDLDLAVADLSWLNTFIDSVTNDNVLSVAEKQGDLATIVADLEARYSDVKARATAAGVSTTAMVAAYNEWWTFLNALNPAWNDTSQKTVIYNPKFPDGVFPVNWTAVGTISTTANGAYTTVTDSDAASVANYLRSAAIPADTGIYSAGVVVKKDAASTRTVGLRLAFSGGTTQSVDVVLDPYTGAVGLNGASVPSYYGALDLGADWLLFVQMSNGGDNTTVSVRYLPAYGNVGGFTSSAAKTGSSDIRGVPLLSRASRVGLGRYMMKGRINALAASIVATSKAISEFDSSTTDWIDGPATADINYDNAGTTIEANVDLPFVLKTGIGSVVPSGVTWSYTVQEGTVNGFTLASGAQTITPASGVATLTVSAMTTSTALVKISATRNGLTKSFNVVLTKRLAAAAGATGASGASQTSGFTPVTTGPSTYGQITGAGVLSTGSVPAGKTTCTVQVRLVPKMPKTQYTTYGNVGPWNMRYKLQRNVSGTRSDIGSPSTADSNPDTGPATESAEGFVTLQGGAFNQDFTFSVTPGTTYAVELWGAIQSGAFNSAVGVGHTGSVTLVLS